MGDVDGAIRAMMKISDGRHQGRVFVKLLDNLWHQLSLAADAHSACLRIDQDLGTRAMPGGVDECMRECLLADQQITGPYDFRREYAPSSRIGRLDQHGTDICCVV